MADDNSINGTGTTFTGNTLTGRLVYHADLETFAGVEGDAGVQHAQYSFVPVRGRMTGVDATLLQPFPNAGPIAGAPDISGMGMGTFKSLSNSSFAGTIIVNILTRDGRGGYPGHVDFFSPMSGQHLSWDLRATTSVPNPFIKPSGANRFVMIARGGIRGNLVADGVAIPLNGGSGTFIGGFATALIDRQINYFAYNFTVSSLTAGSPR
jgi:hypothetical protein